MGPLVDRVRFPISPVLQELGGGTGVVDLVEVHLVGLGEAEEPDPERRDDEQDDDEEVDAIEPPAALAIE